MADAQLEPFLDVDEIQGNVLGGFNKDFQTLVFLSFSTSATKSAKSWLRNMLPAITLVREVANFRTAFKARAALDGREPAEMVALWQNVAFTYQGLAKLTPDARLFAADAFVSGATAASLNLGDPALGPFSAANWVIGSPLSIPDLIWIIAGDTEDDVAAALEKLTDGAVHAGLTVLHIDEGRDLGVFNSELKGREHFGFRDGISQPGVRGKISPTAYLEIGRLPPDPDNTIPEFAEQGRPLVCAGEFVIGYARQTQDFPRTPSPPDLLGPKPSAPAAGTIGPWWMLNGSFLVFRRLRQDVAGFSRFLAAQTSALERTSSQWTSDRLGALLVGRWHSGAPVIRTPMHDNPMLGANDQANNIFLYVAGGDPNDGFGRIPSDSGGIICPAAAHIRKVNPRDHDTDQGGSNITLTKRILRRGIPYGKPLATGSTADDGQDRGLLFLSYQRSIGAQFEFLCEQWMNSAFNPQSGSTVGGFDLLVGQNASSPSRNRQCLLPIAQGGAPQTVPSNGVGFQQYVNPTGAGYFFSPSLTALREILTAP